MNYDKDGDDSAQDCYPCMLKRQLKFSQWIGHI